MSPWPTSNWCWVVPSIVLVKRTGARRLANGRRAETSQGLPEDKVGAVHGATVADGPRFLKLHGKEDPKGFVVSARPGTGAKGAMRRDNEIESESVCPLGTSIIQKSRGLSVRGANWTVVLSERPLKSGQRLIDVMTMPFHRGRQSDH